ncbi:MAG: hypothetical protein MI757_13520 [Pirellulales bacterium]|nr:hypothetical protein [Pirellulales bacterium]
MSEEVSTEETTSASKDPLSPARAAEHRAGVAYSADLVSISRNVLYAQAVLIVMVAAIFFMAGYAIGPGRAATEETPVEKKEKFGKSVDIPGRITFSDSAGSANVDPGAVVILLPKGSETGDRLSADGLRPADPKPTEELPSLGAIEFMGGAYTRADDLAEINMSVRSGRYYVLVISKSAARKAGSKLKSQDAEEMEAFFDDPQALIGDRRYEWKLEKLGKESWLNISLD